MFNYTVKLNICLEDIEDKDMPYFATLEFYMDNFKIGSHQHDFCENSIIDVRQLLEALHGNIPKAQLYADGGNGCGSTTVENKMVKFSTSHYGLCTEMNLPVNASLITAYEEILCYYVDDDKMDEL